MNLQSVVIEKKSIEGGVELTFRVRTLVCNRQTSETLTLRYLTSLVANHADSSYFKVTINTGNYREKEKNS